MSMKLGVVKILKIIGIILLAIAPTLWVCIVHNMALSNGLPYNQSCCMVSSPDPSQLTVNYFLTVETNGSIIGLVYTIVVTIIFSRKFWSCQKAKDKMSALYLFVALLLFGQSILMLCWATVFLGFPAHDYDSYIKSYLSHLFLITSGNIDLPMPIKALDEICAFVYIVLPLSLVISLAYHLFFLFNIKHKTRNSKV